MKTGQEFPGFDEQFPELDQFIIELTDQLHAGNIASWDDLATRVHTFFTDKRMSHIESLVPNWCKMASYANGLTLVHVMCVFMGLYRMPEFLQLSPRQQQIMKWVILLHDVQKELPDGKRDHGHAFRSTAGAARTLPALGFPVMPEYVSTVDNWDEYTRSALSVRKDTQEFIQDNRKLPYILDGIERMFGHNTPAALILKTILFHLSVDMNFWPPPSPLTKAEVKKYLDLELLPLLRVMNLGDNDGWNMFQPDLREHGRVDTLQVFEQIETFILQGAYMDKEFWESIAKNNYKIPEEHTLENLTDILFSYLSSVDPGLRDDIAYFVYANLLEREMYASETIRSHVEKLLANLEKGIGETSSDTVFVRAFSVLLLAEIVHNDNKKPLLDKPQIKKILERGIWYLGAEQDPRGFIPVKGWAHALAHTADLILVLARNRHIDAADLWSMLTTIANKIVHSTNHVYIHSEDDRLAKAIIEIMRRDLITHNQLETWASSLTQPDGKTWKDAPIEEEKNRAFQNTRNVLRSLHLALLEQDEEFPERDELIMLTRNTLTNLRPR